MDLSSLMIFYILVYCDDIAGISDLGLDPMIVFVIRLRASIAPIISQIRDQILKLQANYNFNPEYFTRSPTFKDGNRKFIFGGVLQIFNSCVLHCFKIFRN